MTARWFRRLLAALPLSAALLAVAPPSWADGATTITVGGISIPAPTSVVSPGASGGVGATVAPGEVAAGADRAMKSIGGLIGTLIQSAVEASQTIHDESDKFAGALAVITIVIAGVRFASTGNAIVAWGQILEDLAMLGIFASLYMGYQSFATGFYGWFVNLSTKIAGADITNVVSAMFHASGTLFDDFVQSFAGAAWYEYPAHLVAVIPLLLAFVVLILAGLVFLYYSYVGLIQMAIGAVMGQVALALGFSEFTRGFFKTWLDYMISAGMYVVVAACMQRLVGGSLATAISTASGLGLSTPMAATNVMSLAIFMLLLAFEIPKMASMFGGGANASGSALGKAAKLGTKLATSFIP
ncbi:type IV secretion system protein [Burkholderia vietnamiensis]|uniref:type IV secretion system protein n=1 Tax=Burkholderia vietnamiensis TaxID=60552 RepID=UPI002654DBE4|nr:type IV secretion system protein [Burkholderia vietnamiensis]MDN8035849.1 type IV secretion system protein [Burkholderia vietnamiensis]HDR8964668.1 type IV secretion system protein [Burkholderia vietnamiensis]